MKKKRGQILRLYEVVEVSGMGKIKKLIRNY
jgi:hypothetical protein